MFLNLPESGVDCPLIQFRDSHICVSLVKVFPLGQSRRSTLKSVERRREGVPCGRTRAGGSGAERSGAGRAGGAAEGARCYCGSAAPGSPAGEPGSRSPVLPNRSPSRRRAAAEGHTSRRGSGPAPRTCPAAWERPCRAAGEYLRGVGLTGGQQGPGSRGEGCSLTSGRAHLFHSSGAHRWRGRSCRQTQPSPALN